MPSNSTSSRKTSYKPNGIANVQEYRRKSALEEQKKRRAQKIELARNIDLLGSLSLSPQVEPSNTTNDSDEGAEIPLIVREGLSNYASLVAPTASPMQAQLEPTSTEKRKRKKKKQTVGTSRPKSGAPTYANRCMYAELLEMHEESQWSVDGVDGMSIEKRTNGLPDNLETRWVALAPIPMGKRCLAVTQTQHSGQSPITPTHLHSRLKGVSLLKFPSLIPPDSILDCILDSNWTETGILHVFDILRWRGTDFDDCEAEFRFWWRDARLSEIPHSHLNSIVTSPSTQPKFSYPTTFHPVPYVVPPISLATYLSTIIPAARSIKHVELSLPTIMDGSMDVDGADSQDIKIAVPIETDGLLLYVSEASYQPGETPLSAWVPAKPLTTTSEEPSIKEPPLDLFERLIRERATTTIQLEQSANMDT
jgi:snurportin-1